MAVETQERTPGTTAPRSGMLGYKTGRERPAGGFELWSWLFMRISGIVLLFLAVGHVLIMHVVDEGVNRVDFAFVQDRWANPLWRTWDWALLVLSLIHGINGLRVVVQDYVRWPGARFAINMLFYVVGFSLFVLGTIIVFTFDANEVF
ncbi:MAG TPA: succinate dehydrogenase hydrophobic membrane anchor subunit [Actinomycetota bacterium]|jgi:succinate dehydrogenase / fumarate reductase membrane anchor subunit|nr:succinate dehydrogenase hydrophobic membrane anchor subunit [Actinomycetota bacterium]